MIEELVPRLMAGLVLCAVFLWLMHELRKRPSLLRQLEVEMREGGWLRRRLGRASLFRLRVYSAETLDGREAEFIRDRLPTKLPALLIIGMIALGALVALWYATR
jgi:hypothetical protein